MICLFIFSLDSQFFTNNKVNPRLFCTESDSGQWSYAMTATGYHLEACSSMLENCDLCARAFWVFNIRYIPSLDCWALCASSSTIQYIFLIGIGFVNPKFEFLCKWMMSCKFWLCRFICWFFCAKSYLLQSCALGTDIEYEGLYLILRFFMWCLVNHLFF